MADPVELFETNEEEWLLPSGDSYTDTQYELVPPGEYEVTLVEVGDLENGNYGPYFRAHYEIVDGPHAGSRLSSLVNVDGVTGAATRFYGEPGQTYDAVVWHSAPDANDRVFPRLSILPPQGAYTFRIVKFGPPVAGQDPTNPKKKRLPVTFEIVEGDWAGYRITRSYSFTMYPQGRLYPVVKAALGQEPDPEVQYGGRFSRRKGGEMLPGIEGLTLMNNIVHNKGRQGGVFANFGDTPWPVPRSRPKIKPTPGVGAAALNPASPPF